MSSRVSCRLCFETAGTVGMIENHIENDHDVTGHVSEYWERVEVDESGGESNPTFLKDYA